MCIFSSVDQLIYMHKVHVEQSEVVEGGAPRLLSRRGSSKNILEQFCLTGSLDNCPEFPKVSWVSQGPPSFPSVLEFL